MTYRKTLRDAALAQYGYVTVDDARRFGIDTGELRNIARRGGLTHVTYGLYRFDDVPPTRFDQYIEAVLRVGAHAYLTHDAVLSLHGLGLVNPSVIRVGTSKRTQANLPSWLEVVRQDVPPEDLTIYEAIPSTTVRRALLDCRGLIMTDRLLEAASDAADRGLLRRRERQETIDTLKNWGV